MKRLFFVLQIGLFTAFNFSLLLTGYQFANNSSSAVPGMGYNIPVYDQKEEYDPKLNTLNTVDKLMAFCDGLYSEKANNNATIKADEVYPDIVSAVIRKRFYHGYSSYGFSNNYMARVVAGFTVDGLCAIVIPNDILRFPYAACSQQSIVFMEILKRKGFLTRKVGFKGKENGHFCFEVYYNKSWHFYDPDMEPDTEVLAAYNHPDIAFLAKNPDILLQAYSQYPKEKTLNLFLDYSYGSVNTFSAPKAILFQKVTKFLSYSVWAFFLLAFILVRRKYKRLKAIPARNTKNEYVMQTPAPVPSAYYAA